MPADPRVVDKLYELLVDADRELGIEDRQRFGLLPGDIEPVLDALVKQRGVLLRGSGSKAEPGTPLGLTGPNAWAHATDEAAIALLQALFSNEVPRHLNKWTFPMHITRADPLVIKVVNPRPGFQRSRGYVYVLGREGFRNHPVPSWQWVSNRNDRRVHGRVEVERRDFHYPVESVTRL
jgi:hypothetical protein